MLKREVISDKTYNLLKEIMEKDEFKNFSLFGGTALSLQIAHRKSIDLDFIQFEDFKSSDIRNKIIRYYNYDEIRQAENLTIGNIDNIKVDFVAENSNLINPIINDDGIRILSKEDICAMKLMAICDNGTRIKDYVDIAVLSTYFSLNEMIQFFEKKYNVESSILPIRPISDFSKVDTSVKVDMIINGYSWDNCKNRILDMIANPEKVYK